MQSMPKNIQKILIKLLKKLNLWQENNIDWYSPLEIFIDELQSTIYITYTNDYLIFTSHLPYENSISKNWEVLNTLNNPIYQPSVLVYTSEADKNIIIWSKENANKITYQDIQHWLKIFLNVLYKIKEDLIDILGNNNTNNNYEFLANKIKK